MRDGRVFILGVPVDVVDQPAALEAARQAIAAGQPLSIYAVNPEKVMRARRDARLRSALRQAALLIPDGIGVVLAARLNGHPAARRVAGSELMPALCALAAAEGHPVFLYGGAPQTVEGACAALRARYPELIIAGFADGYLEPGAAAGLIDTINASGARLLFVGLGSPRQELWVDEQRARLRVEVVQCVGGTFDVLAGKVERAPDFWIRCNLEWLYRLLTDPRRSRRQLVLPLFALLVLGERLRRGRR